MTDDTKKCPFCAETIKVEARKCKHCGEFLPGHSREAIWRELMCGNIEVDDLEAVEGAAAGDEAQALEAVDRGAVDQAHKLSAYLWITGM